MSAMLSEVIPESERALLAGVVTEPAAVRFASPHVTEADFANPRYGQLFSLVCEMVNAGRAASLASICDEVTKRAAARLGGTRWPSVAEIGQLLDVGATASVEYHALVVREQSVRRQVVATHRRGMQRAEQASDVTTLVADGIKELTEIRDGQRFDGLPFKTLGEVLSMPTDYDWVIPGLLERGDRLIVTGGEGAGKSTFVRQIAILAAAGLHPFTGRPTAPVKVCVIDAENSERQWNRKAGAIATAARMRGQVDPAETLDLSCVGRLDLTTERDLGKVHAALDRYEPEILFIGPLYKLVPRAINNDDDAAPLITALDSLRDRGPALVMEAHAGHAQTKGGDRDLRPRGSSALMGWPEFGFGIQLDREQEQLAHLVRWRGDRDERDWPESMEKGGVFPWSPPSRGWTS